MRASLLAVAFALAFLPAAGAEGCVPTSSTTGWDQVVIGPEPVQQLYIANDLCQPECVISMWFYIETNDIPGLQRSDERHDDTCGGQIESDTIVS